MRFGDDIRRIAEARGVEAGQLARGVYIDAVESVVRNTPVDEGFARGSWVGSINTPSGSLPNTPDLSNNGEVTADRAIADTANFQIGDTMFLTSNAPYMEKLEYGGYSQGPNSTGKTNSQGYSIQAPNGMVRITVQQILASLRAS